MLLAPGDTIADITLPAQDGEERSLHGLLGEKGAVIYFYPKDNTPGCTVEATDFERLQGEFAARGYRVVGVSKDSVKSHAGFCAKHSLTFTLLSDEEGTLCEAFGVWQEKKNYGRTYMGIARTTFVVDAAATVAKVYPKVKTEGHAQAVLSDLAG